jgi:hypothetical protein
MLEIFVDGILDEEGILMEGSQLVKIPPAEKLLVSSV